MFYRGIKLFFAVQILTMEYKDIQSQNLDYMYDLWEGSCIRILFYCMTYSTRSRQSARIVTTNAEKSAEVEVADCEPIKAKD